MRGHVEDPSGIRNANQVVKDYLARVISSVVKMHIVDGRLPDYAQHAVRILESRQRELDRIINAKYGSGDIQLYAKAELSLVKPDMGDLIVMGGRRHSVGRLDCRACLFEYSDVVISAIQQVVYLSRVCTACSQGVQHVLMVPEKELPMPGLPMPESEPDKAEDLIVEAYWCDVCGAKQPRKHIADEAGG